MALDKIKALLIKSNVSEEVASKITEAMEEYKAKVVAESQEELAKKVRAAKTVVLEEVEKYKLDLSRRVQLFCESKSQTIEKQLMRKSAAGETEANAKLTGVKALLEGINLNGKPNSKLTAKLADAQSQLKRMNKQLTTTKSQAERSIRLAESVMEKNQKLIKENKSLQGVQLVKETKEQSAIMIPSKRTTPVIDKQVVIPAKQISESVEPKIGIVKESVNVIDKIAAKMR